MALREGLDMDCENRSGFTLIEVLIVIVLIGILSALAYSSLNELIQTNKAKEVAREMTSFVERSIAEGKMRKKEVVISIINSNTLQASMDTETPIVTTKIFAHGFSAGGTDKPSDCVVIYGNGGITSKIRIGDSGIDEPGCFVACNPRGYCGSTVKIATKNTFSPFLKKRNSNTWEPL
jgi:prepilin-type N-terminal cleavage/methylation domain-containing protein